MRAEYMHRIREEAQAYNIAKYGRRNEYTYEDYEGDLSVGDLAQWLTERAEENPDRYVESDEDYITVVSRKEILYTKEEREEARALLRDKYSTRYNQLVAWEEAESGKLYNKFKEDLDKAIKNESS